MTVTVFYKKLREYLFAHAVSAGLFNGWSDERFLKYAYKRSVGKERRFGSPTCHNEKLQWLKLYNRRPEYTTMVDKYDAKKYVADKIGREYIIPTIGVWDSFDEIDFDALPEQFVLKCTHDSGGLVICRDKDSLDISAAREKLTEHLSRNYYWIGREWPYKDIKPRILAEEYMQDKYSENLTVYKIFNFSGNPTIIQVIQDDKTKAETIDYFDTEWNLLELKQNFPNSPSHLPKPMTLSVMLELANKLSDGVPFVRTDFYEINNKVYFSEFTFFSDNGLVRFHPDAWDKTLGDLIDLKHTKP